MGFVPLLGGRENFEEGKALAEGMALVGDMHLDIRVAVVDRKVDTQVLQVAQACRVDY